MEIHSPEALKKLDKLKKLESENKILRIRLGLDDPDPYNHKSKNIIDHNKNVLPHDEPAYFSHSETSRRLSLGLGLAEISSLQSMKMKSEVSESAAKLTFRKVAAMNSDVWCGCCKGAGFCAFFYKKKKPSTIIPINPKASNFDEDAPLEKSPTLILDEKLTGIDKVNSPTKITDEMYPPISAVMSRNNCQKPPSPKAQKTHAPTTLKNMSSSNRIFENHVLKDGHDWTAYTVTFGVGSLGMKLNIHPDATGCFVHHVEENSTAHKENVKVNDKIVKVGNVEVINAKEAMAELKKQPRPVILTFHKQTKLIEEQVRLQVQMRQQELQDKFEWTSYSVNFGPGPLGMKLNIHPEAIGCFVHHVIPNSAASKSNIQVNDKIVAVGNVLVTNAIEALEELRKQTRPVVLTFHKRTSIIQKSSDKNSEYSYSIPIIPKIEPQEGKTGSPRIQTHIYRSGSNVSISNASPKALASLGVDEQVTKKAANVLGRLSTDNPDEFVSAKASVILGVPASENSRIVELRKIKNERRRTQLQREDSDDLDLDSDSDSAVDVRRRKENSKIVKLQKLKEMQLQREEIDDLPLDSSSDSSSDSDSAVDARRRKEKRKKERKRKILKKKIKRRKRRNSSRKRKGKYGSSDSSDSSDFDDDTSVKRYNESTTKTFNIHLARVESKFKMTPPPKRLTWKEKMELRRNEKVKSAGLS
jgi:hypothetical protein